MIGNKKLSEIRQQIAAAFSGKNGDPLQRLERQIASSKRKEKPAQVLEGLKRLLEQSPLQRINVKKAGKHVG